MTTAPLAVGGNRLHWQDLPPYLRKAVEAAAGAPVRVAENRPEGFSPGLASVLRLADGDSVFVKAVSADRNQGAVDLHRREARVLPSLPRQVPTPRLRWEYDDGHWVVLMIDAVDGRTPRQPWRDDELVRYLASVAELAESLTPAPIAAAPVQENHREVFTGWRQMAGTPGGADHLPEWVRRRLPQLAEIEQTWPAAASGRTLLHADLRADNVLVTGDGGVQVVDWPHACVGAAWLELLFAIPSICMHGGGDPERLWRDYPPAGAADPDAVTAMLAALVGFFCWSAAQPPPPNLPELRAFQLAQGREGLAWLRRRLSGRTAP